VELAEAKERFINAWGTLGSSWGISRSMAQVHALLLISPGPLSTEDVMAELSISRGNANMTLRELIDWGLIRKETRLGERREFFTAEKDVWKIFKQVAKVRRQKELAPVLSVLEEVSHVDGDKRNKEVKTFLETIDNLHSFAKKTDKTLETVIRADENWFLGPFMRLMR
jgi:DNA-binding transcriptional regulator GbsR (MarR family)